MSKEKAKHIHIEDGNAEEKEKTAAEEVMEEASEGAEAEEPEEEKAEEKAKEKAEADAEAEPEEKKEEASAEEQESERYMRLMAEFQNFKRRAAKEKSDIHAFANERIVGDLLPVMDNFERALETETDDIEAYAKGMQLIFEQMKTALEKAGLKEIEALGLDFDPNVHNAVMTDNTEEYENDKISKVLQKGYKLNDKVIRPSMVAVNKR
ncbi:MAG: nucleotide exchange factor GrpE [Mogibacterium sp.]|nr:nucleotide exchange factor GrpE [Mogibacterium sp.]